MFVFVVHQHCDVCSEFFMPSFMFLNKPFSFGRRKWFGRLGSSTALLRLLPAQNSAVAMGARWQTRLPFTTADFECPVFAFLSTTLHSRLWWRWDHVVSFTRFLCEWGQHQSFLGCGKCVPNIWVVLEHDLSFLVVDNHSQAPEFINTQ